MKVTNTNMDRQKTVCISYDSMDELIDREAHMTKTLQGYLDRNNNTQFIEDINISMTDKKYILTFTLGITE